MGSPHFPMNRVDLALRLQHHQAVCRFHYRVGVLDILLNLGRVEDISGYGIIARFPPRCVAVCGWSRYWRFLCRRGWRLGQGEFRYVAVKLKINNLIVEIAMIAFNVEPITVDLQSGVKRFEVPTATQWP